MRFAGLEETSPTCAPTPKTSAPSRTVVIKALTITALPARGLREKLTWRVRRQVQQVH